ncbi:MAG: helix-turn-helix transcriptional regulator [Thermodesulfobacteriota bacterium]
MIEIPEPIGKYDRFYYLIECLSNHKTGATVEEIAEAVMKSEKTVRRDLKSMEGSIFDIDVIKARGEDKKYRYRIEKHAAKFRPLVLSAYEVLALYFIRGFAHFKDISFMHNHLGEVFNKIGISAQEAEKISGNEFFKRISTLFILPRELGGKVYSEKKQLNSFEQIIEAAINNQVCEITYGKGETEKKYKISPLHFFNYRDAIYILSKNLTNNENKIITMALHRVKNVVLLNEFFEYPKDFDVDKFFNSSLFNFEGDKHKIKLEFSPEIKDYILEREWYPNQKEELLKDGSVIISFDSEINMILSGWIKGFGSSVKVLEPPELREEIIADLKQNLHKHENVQKNTI